MNSYYLDDSNFFVVAENNVMLDFYEFLDISPSASIQDIRLSLKVKERTLEYAFNNGYLNQKQYLEEKHVLERIDSCLLNGEKNRQIYDERKDKIKEGPIKKKFKKPNLKLRKEKSVLYTKNFDATKLKKTLIKIIIGGVTLAVVVGCSATVINNISDKYDNVISQPNDELTTVYSDENVKYVFRYKVNYGDTMSGIAAKFGVSQDDIRRDNQKSRSILNEGETIYIETDDKALADEQEEIYIENNIMNVNGTTKSR